MNLAFKFHNDPTINKFGIIVLLDKFECMREKESVLEEEKGKRIWE